MAKTAQQANAETAMFRLMKYQHDEQIQRKLNDLGATGGRLRRFLGDYFFRLSVADRAEAKRLIADIEANVIHYVADESGGA